MSDCSGILLQGTSKRYSVKHDLRHEGHAPKKKANSLKNWLLSGWQDSNLRPPAPKAGAMTGLRYTP